ncbi:hypothetical protein MGYG_07479 [Nannizzia gypsea CBS 118893]|uniref:Uncharacterized protein n=1 Tax=Arthroderma gypseum (strain ATCC MYA-4604 / CBS 118893) TaxID=535722 RepID=E4V397_ARTGP|nr:hypothetical protein MGYG_07479 [Nannizzia gypsea CBS 118893]EFR04471.1 hypothetical protein MGYG_07479 [Nannizzia gypsea CBS 118893]
MGWFWGKSSPDADPTKNLDPSLREYLEQESPSKYTPTAAGIWPQQQTQSQEKKTTESSSSQDRTTEATSSVPSASLFPDGRYAHLWKDYKTLEEIEGPNVSPAEKVVEQFKQRKDVLNRAALENCSEEHEDLSLCFKKGTFSDKVKARLTMCGEQNARFSRCYTMQSKFLQALGYGSSFVWDMEKEERIQMHADRLYHRMLDYERRVAEAKEEGREPPHPKSLFKSEAEIAASQETTSQPDDECLIPGGEGLPAGAMPYKPLKEMTPHERELEVQSLKQQMVQRDIYMKEVTPVLRAEEAAKNKRREKFTSWFGETIGNWLA